VHGKMNNLEETNKMENDQYSSLQEKATRSMFPLNRFVKILLMVTIFPIMGGLCAGWYKWTAPPTMTVKALNVYNSLQLTIDTTGRDVENCDNACEMLDSYPMVLDDLDGRITEAKRIYKEGGTVKVGNEMIFIEGRDYAEKLANDNPVSWEEEVPTFFKQIKFGMKLMVDKISSLQSTKDMIQERIELCKDDKPLKQCPDFKGLALNFSCAFFIRESLPMGPCHNIPQSSILVDVLRNFKATHPNHIEYCVDYWKRTFPDDVFNSEELNKLRAQDPWSIRVPKYCKNPKV